MRATIQKKEVKKQSSSAVVAKSMQGGNGMFKDLDFSKLTMVKKDGLQTQSFVADGFVYEFFSYGEMCVSQPVFAFGLAINQCVTDLSGNSYIYTCNENFATKTKYVGSTNCYGMSETLAVPLGCTTEYNDDDYVNQQYISSFAGCTTGGGDIIIPDGNYGVNSYFSDTTCSGTVGYTGIVTGMCVPFGSTSYIINYPNVITYPTTTNCTGASVPENMFPTACSAVTDSMNDDNFPTFGFYQGSLMSGGSSNNGPSAGAIAGVVIGCVIGVALLFAIIFYFVFFYKASPKLSEQEK